MGSNFNSAMFGSAGGVGAVGPMPQTSGLFGTAGSFSSAQALGTASTISGVVGAFGSYQSGRIQQQQFNQQAGSFELQAQGIKLQAMEQSNMLKKQLLADLGSSTASAGARGIDVGSGTPQQILEESIGNVGRDVERIEAGANIGAAGARTSASRSRLQGSSARASGTFRGVTGLAGNIGKFL